MDGLSKLQEAMAYQALYSALAPVVKAGGDGLRGEVDAELREIYERTGAKSYSVTAGGAKLGTYSIVTGNATPETGVASYDLIDIDALVRWAQDDNNAEPLRQWLMQQEGESFARFCVESFGEVPDGVRLRVTTVPAKGEEYRGGRMVVDRGFQKLVTERLASALPALVEAAALPEADG